MCVYVCVFADMCADMCVGVCSGFCIYVRVQECVHTRVCVHRCVCRRLCRRLCVCVCACVCMCPCARSRACALPGGAARGRRGRVEADDGHGSPGQDGHLVLVVRVLQVELGLLEEAHELGPVHLPDALVVAAPQHPGQQRPVHRHVQLPAHRLDLWGARSDAHTGGGGGMRCVSAQASEGRRVEAA